jgi:ACS family glucarate transporter-like MFS transporter
LAGFIGNWVSGVMVDAIYRKNSWKLSRRLPAIIGFSLVIIGLMGSIHMEAITGAIVFLSIAIFGADMTLSPSWSFCIDIGKEHSGTVSGTMNMAGNIGSFLTALAFPYFLEWTGSETPFLYVAAFLSLISIFAWMRMDPEKEINGD